MSLTPAKKKQMYLKQGHTKKAKPYAENWPDLNTNTMNMMATKWNGEDKIEVIQLKSMEHNSIVGNILLTACY